MKIEDTLKSVLSYETAKELKDSGFPQDGNGGFRCECGGYHSPDSTLKRTNAIGHEQASIPTLSELIEACADFEALTKEHSAAGSEWVASAFHRGAHGRGSIPEEAVARLWLALCCAIRCGTVSDIIRL